MATTEVTTARARRMAAMAQRRRPLSRFFHRPDPDRGDPARHGRRRRIRIPGVSPSAAGAFLPGLEKLGLSHLPPAVAAAQYHYLSNWIGGVSVEYMYETDRKAWIRYPPPRWIWRGTAICGVPGEASRAMLRGWHANNGVALGDLNLGFVCTKQSVDGQDGLEGYDFEYDHPLEIDQRLVFARHLEAPLFEPASAPALPVASWPRPRWKKPIAITPWNMCGPPHPSWCNCSAPKIQAISCISPAN